MDKRSNHTKILIRSYLTNVMYYVIMKNDKKNQVPKKRTVVENLGGLMVAGIETSCTVFWIDKYR